MATTRKKALPRALPEGFVLTDSEKKKWRLGKLIGHGGFGLIYLASPETGRPTREDSDFVIKVEYHQNGPLFSELKFYQRAAKVENMMKWKMNKNLDFLGIPTYWGSGLAEWRDLRYRFMVMDRLGSDLQKVCERNGGLLKKATVLQLGQTLVEVLEYIHENEYVHADIKASNLMIGHRDPEKIYLADYGLSYRYCPDGVHKEYKEDPKKSHNGTIEYTSIDAHKGLAPSRRGDLQILGFCLLHWLCGSLPWDNILNSPVKVQEAKTRLMDNLPESVQQLPGSGARTGEVVAFLLYVRTLNYQDKPNYQRLKQLLGRTIRGRLDLSAPTADELASGGSSGWIKKTGGANGPRPGPPEGTDKIHEGVKPRHVPAQFIRGPPLPKSQQVQCRTVPAEIHEGVKPRHVPAQFIRGPPLPKDQQKDENPPDGKMSTRSKAEPAHSDEGDDGKAECLQPITVGFTKGPPMQSSTVSKQRTSNTRPSRSTEEEPLTLRRPEQPLHLWERRHMWANGDARSQMWAESGRGLADGPLRGSEGCCCWRRRRRSGEPERGASTLASWLAMAAVLLLLGALFGANQSTFKFQ